VENIT